MSREPPSCILLGDRGRFLKRGRAGRLGPVTSARDAAGSCTRRYSRLTLGERESWLVLTEEDVIRLWSGPSGRSAWVSQEELAKAMRSESVFLSKPPGIH